MNFDQLKQLPGSRIKALVGLVPALLGELLFQVVPELERRRRARLPQRAERKRHWGVNEGSPREVTPLAKVLMTLIYLRHHVSPEVGGVRVGYSADTSENACHEVVPVLRDLLPAQKGEADKKWRRSEPPGTPAEVDLVSVESFETPVRRPSGPERQRWSYSGKKKRHTLKTQLATAQAGEILTISAGQRGPKAELKLYEQTPWPEPLTDKPRLGDKAYVSSEHPELTTPHKKPKGGQLTEEQVRENKPLSSRRVRVEPAIRRVKGFRLLRAD